MPMIIQKLDILITPSDKIVFTNAQFGLWKRGGQRKDAQILISKPCFVTSLVDMQGNVQKEAI